MFVFYHLEQMTGGSVSLWDIWELLEDSRGPQPSSQCGYNLSQKEEALFLSAVFGCALEKEEICQVFPPCQALPDGKV